MGGGDSNCVFGRPVASMERLNAVVAAVTVEQDCPALRFLGTGAERPVAPRGSLTPSAPIPPIGDRRVSRCPSRD